MKLLVVFLCALSVISCGDAKEPKDVSTVDPNVQESLDTIPLELHLDSLNNTIALDSMGPTINPEDTNYKRR